MKYLCTNHLSKIFLRLTHTNRYLWDTFPTYLVHSHSIKITFFFGFLISPKKMNIWLIFKWNKNITKMFFKRLLKWKVLQMAFLPTLGSMIIILHNCLRQCVVIEQAINKLFWNKCKDKCRVLPQVTYLPEYNLRFSNICFLLTKKYCCSNTWSLRIYNSLHALKSVLKK